MSTFQQAASGTYLLIILALGLHFYELPLLAWLEVLAAVPPLLLLLLLLPSLSGGGQALEGSLSKVGQVRGLAPPPGAGSGDNMSGRTESVCMYVQRCIIHVHVHMMMWAYTDTLYILYMLHRE